MIDSSTFRDLGTADVWIRVAASVVLGGAIGLERQLRGKPAGMRTSILIVLGTVGFIVLGTEADGQPHADPTRVLGQLVTGIGFLGAGVIIQTQGGAVTGVTSAAVVWLLAAIGSAIGFARLDWALALAVTTLGVLVLIDRLERRFSGVLRRGAHAPDPIMTAPIMSGPTGGPDRRPHHPPVPLTRDPPPDRSP